MNFVPTHHWLPPRYQRGVDAGVGSFCAMEGTDGTNTCIPWSPQLIAEFRDAMVVCFSEALKMGLTINVRPHLVRARRGRERAGAAAARRARSHGRGRAAAGACGGRAGWRPRGAAGRLAVIPFRPSAVPPSRARPAQDDGSPEKNWRNGLKFNPLQQYEGYSYNDIMLVPLADALRISLANTRGQRPQSRPKIYFSLQGEMGGTGEAPAGRGALGTGSLGAVRAETGPGPGRGQSGGWSEAFDAERRVAPLFGPVPHRSPAPAAPIPPPSPQWPSTPASGRPWWSPSRRA
jgi:hypothetical protein